jgi:hypothetical protein
MRMLAVLATAAKTVSAHALAAVVAEEIRIIDRYWRAADGPARVELGRVKAAWLEFDSWVSDNPYQPSRAGTQPEGAVTLAGQVGDAVGPGYATTCQAQPAAERRRAGTAAPPAMDARLPARVEAPYAIREAHAHA